MNENAFTRIRDGLAAWSRGDLEGALHGLDPEIEWIPSGLFPGVDPSYHGHEGFRQFWSDFRELWERIEIDVVQIVEGEPSRFAVLGRFEATGRNGIPVGRSIGMVFVIPGDLVTEVQGHPTWDGALESAGVAADRHPTR